MNASRSRLYLQILVGALVTAAALLALALAPFAGSARADIDPSSCTATWNGGSGSFYPNAPGSWTGPGVDMQGNPADGATVCILADGSNVTIDANTPTIPAILIGDGNASGSPATLTVASHGTAATSEIDVRAGGQISLDTTGSGSSLNAPVIKNAGTIAVTAGSDDRHIDASAMFTNSGSLNVNGKLIIQENAQNTGTVTTSGSGDLIVSFLGGTPGIFTNAGSIVNNATFEVNGGSNTEYIHASGNVTGNPVEFNAGAHLDLHGTGTGTFVSLPGNTFVRGNIGSGITLRVEGRASGASATLAANNPELPTAGFTNNGTIQLTSTGASPGDATISLGGKSLTNNGTISILPGTGGGRQFGGSGPGNNLTNAAGGTITFGAPTSVFDPVTSGGTTHVNSTVTLMPGFGGSFTQTGGTLTGSGTIAGSPVVNGGQVAPGSSPGTLTVNGDYTQGSGATLRADIAGTAPGSGYDRLAVTGNATIAGTLALNGSAFTPSDGQVFDVLAATGTVTGTFGAVTGTNAGGGRTYNVSYQSSPPGHVRVGVVPQSTSPGGGGGGTPSTPPPSPKKKCKKAKKRTASAAKKKCKKKK